MNWFLIGGPAIVITAIIGFRIWWWRYEQNRGICPICHGEGIEYNTFDHYRCRECHGTGRWTR